MIRIKETAIEDLNNVQRLWEDGDVMRFVGFPYGLFETYESMLDWLEWTASSRPGANHYSIYDGEEFCGETSYSIDEASGSASVDIKLFGSARGRGIATEALSYVIGEAFKNGAKTVWVDPDPENAAAIALYHKMGFKRKDMPEHVIALGEDPETNIYFELHKD